MSGVTPLVDTLLATRLASRPDLVPLKGQVQIAGPGAVTGTEKAVNDIRLPSRAALEQQLGVALPGRGDGNPASRTTGPDGAVTLSATARAIVAILGARIGPDLKIEGAEPLWPHRRAPLGPLLAKQLAHAVASSGLFYESHLQQHAAGVRSLAQLAWEPQAGLALPDVKAVSVGAEAEPVLAARPSHAGSAAVTAADPGNQAGAASTPVPRPAEPASRLDVPPLSAVYGRAGTLENERASWHGIAEQDPGAERLAAPASGAAGSGNPVAAAIHPDAMTLVRLQLELLTVPVLRWAGEAWPGAPMDWSIHEEQQDDSQAGADGQAAPAAWTTRVAITLPSLKSIEVRLTLAGVALQVHLAPEEDTTLAVLEEGREALSARFGAAGLQLTGLHIGAGVTGNAARDAPKDGHG